MNTPYIVIIGAGFGGVHINGKRLKPFQYKDPGLLATIGRNAAVARIWGVCSADASPGYYGSSCTSFA